MTWGKHALDQLRRVDLPFEHKLRQVERLVPMADPVLGAQLIGVLLDSAMEVKPSKQELYYLCDASKESEMIAEFLRAHFMSESLEPQRLEMAERLEQVLSFRISERRKPIAHDTKLHQTVAEYLLRARN